MRFVILMCLALSCWAQDAYTIAGRVVRHSDRQPLRGVQVSLAMTKEANHEVSVISGNDGEFAFRGLAAGRYRLRATEHGMTRAYQQSDGYSTAIVAGPNLDTEHLAFAVELPASLSGKVVDEENDPQPNLQVYLFHQSVVGGRYQISYGPVGATQTNGTFHFRNLEPGTYYLAVVGRPWYAYAAYEQQPRSTLDVAYATTYYADATSAEGATPLKLGEGQKAEIQMTVHAVPSVHVKIDGLNRREVGRATGVMITQAGPGGTVMHLSMAMRNSEIVGLAPGTYTVTLNGSTQKVTLTGDTELPTGGSVQTSLKGKVILDGEEKAGATRLMLTNDAGSNQLAPRIGPDGTFEVPGVQPGHYTLGFVNTPDTYVAKVEAKGSTYVNGVLDVAAGANVELVITPGHGLTKVEGTVAVGGATVLLIPADRSLGRPIGRGQSDSDGNFSISGVAPGRYTLVAIDDGQGLAYADPAVIAPYLQHGQVVTVPINKVGEVEVQKRLQ